MKRWIRWQGLSAFLIIIVLVALFWFLFIDNIIKSNIEKYGSKAVGAKVEVSKADLSLIPFGLSLDNVKITNPNAPMKNAVEFERAAMSIELGKLLMRKVIIDEMAIEGVKFNTDRRTSGALPSITKKEAAGKKETDKGKGLSMPSFEMPKVEDILAKADLKTLDAVNNLKKDIQEAERKWKEKLNSLPDKEKLKSYKDRVEKLKGSSGGITGMLGKAKEAASLKKDIQKDLTQIKEAARDFKQQKSELQNRIQTVSSLPSQDVNNLMQKYAFSAEGAENYTRLLFGNKAADYFGTAMYWYKKIIPYLEGSKNKEDTKEASKVRAEGENVYFREKNPLPRFLIKTANADLSLEAGDLSGKIHNITSSQRILGKALTFDFSGKKLKQADSVAFSGSIDHSSAKSADTFNVGTKNYRVNNINLSNSESLPIRIENALADLNGNAKIVNGKLNMQLAAMMNNVNFGEMPGKNKTGEILKTALSEISQFRINADVKGTVDDYNIALSSTIGQSLNNAMSKVIKTQTAEFKDKLRKGIEAKVDTPLQNLKQNYAGLDSIQEELNSRLKIGDELTGVINIF